MGVFRNLQSIFPLPRSWKDDEKQFGIRLDSAYKKIQTQLFDLSDNKVVGKRIQKSVAASDGSVRIDVPNGCCCFAILSLPTINRVWVGIWYVTGNGTVTVQQINSSSGLTLTTGTNRINVAFSYSSASIVQLLYIIYRGNVEPKFH